MSLIDRLRKTAALEDEACELVAVATLAAAEAGSPPASALALALDVTAVRFGPMIEVLRVVERRLRFGLDGGAVARNLASQGPGAALVAEVAEAERNGDDLRERMQIFLKNSFERREYELRQRIEVFPVYMIVVLVLFFMPAILIVLVGPSFFALLRVLYEV
ncbi:MAG: type II secretion system F family protein [Phenylobacterium sp.]|uniref:type II secretion system F family protein n=1 Tax=Phenylobacterium sp. TaxID=1871053 RepID=UPI003BB59767